ncbi:hypothetical protein [Mycolicibacterium gilvum]|uniref:hypothetical protein n=1 Tax=Mycolicibacterium gilvum TaxID=1804 RepID=UPI000E1B6CEA|nr:hypothetical protein [Mycolicibacterium gilvum]MCV7057906.1 hypothetical protein [Mycolicibacterium gilvum]
MAGRADSDEHYVLDLCDEVLGLVGRRQQRFDWLRGDPSPSRPRGTELPVDGYWPGLEIVVEFQEEQHSEAVEFFDRRQTVSGVGRAEQRRRYDERKRTEIPAHGMQLVVIEKSVFTVKSKRIARDRARDLAVVREQLDSRCR